jgi:mRNA-degrading endonuclease RelE of RelBE toxin-antitoxin system
MSYSVITIHTFEKQAKRLLKKYPSLKQELSELISSLKLNPEQGTPLGNNSFKIRLSISSKGKGKSGGARVITHLYIQNTTVILLTIFDKSEQSNITDNDIRLLLKQIPF